MLKDRFIPARIFKLRLWNSSPTFNAPAGSNTGSLVLIYSPHMRLLRYLLLLACAASAAGQTPPTYQPQIDTLADRLARDIQRLSQPPAHKSALPPRILVADFPNQRGQSNVLGQRIADALADAQQTRLSPNALLPRKQFQEAMQSAGISPDDLRKHGVLAWQAAHTGANLLITGRLSRTDETTTLELTLTHPDGDQVSTASTELTLSPDLAKLARDPVDWSPDPNAAMVCPSPADTKGATPPKCTLCNPPSFTEAARKAGWQGNLLLKVAVDEQGQVHSAIVLIGGPYGVGEHAVETVRQWQFQPATKDGQPVRICVPVEVNLRYY